MKGTRRHCVVWVTVPNRVTARRLARAVLEARAVACVNIVSRVESHYWWKGRLEKGKELLLIMKTVRGRLEALEELVRAIHPYETPEFVVISLQGGSESYLDWVDVSLGGSGMEIYH